jgi:hypothetical protein
MWKESEKKKEHEDQFSKNILKNKIKKNQIKKKT